MMTLLSSVVARRTAKSTSAAAGSCQTTLATTTDHAAAGVQEQCHYTRKGSRLSKINKNILFSLTFLLVYLIATRHFLLPQSKNTKKDDDTSDLRDGTASIKNMPALLTTVPLSTMLNETIVTTDHTTLSPQGDNSTQQHQQNKNKDQSKDFVESCGCPSSCNFWNLMDMIPTKRFLCDERIQFLIKRRKAPRLEACIDAANGGFCTPSCHPEICAPFTPEPIRSPATKEEVSTPAKTIQYVLDTQEEGQYHTSYDYNICKNRPNQFPPTLSQRGQLDFATHITTNLTILVMGDSVGAHQIGENFMEAASFNLTQQDINSTMDTRIAMMTRATTHIKPHTKRPNMAVKTIATRGGGTAISYRANAGMLSHKLLRDTIMGVSAYQLRRLQQHLHATTGSKHVDAMVLHIPSGWIGFEHEISDGVTQETLAESVRLAGEMFGAKTVVLLTVMLSNNLFKDLQGLFSPLRKKVYDFAKYFRANVNLPLWHGVEKVVVLDLASLSLELVLANAHALGLMTPRLDQQYRGDARNTTRNHSGSEYSEYTALQKVLREHTLKKKPKHGRTIDIPMALVCSEISSTNATMCTPNRISLDGMHWCMKNGIGGRMQAGLACVLSCAYPSNHNENANEENAEKKKQSVGGGFSISDCESKCNNRFMNVDAVTFGEQDLLTPSAISK